MSCSNTFGGTIKLEGEKQYRAAIQQINSELKVMASEMVKVTAEFEKMVRSTPRPVDEAGVLTNRKKYRAERSAPNEQCDNISDRAKSAASLTSQNKILNEQIEKQKEKISTLKNALEQSSEKYGENGSQHATSSGRSRRADEQEEIQSRANGARPHRPSRERSLCENISPAHLQKI